MNRKQRTDLANNLAKHIPEAAIPTVVYWFEEYNFQLTVTRKRNSKLGDYRAPWKNDGHRISVNGDLNRYAFLITLTHEIAHLVTWNEHRSKVAPHGIEWKRNFHDLMREFMANSVFPKDVEEALQVYLSNPAASSCVDTRLYKVLRNHNEQVGPPTVLVEDLATGAWFQTRNGKVFQLKKKLRKRYLCEEYQTKKEYAFSPIAEVWELVKD